MPVMAKTPSGGEVVAVDKATAEAQRALDNGAGETIPMQVSAKSINEANRKYWEQPGGQTFPNPG